MGLGFGSIALRLTIVAMLLSCSTLPEKKSSEAEHVPKGFKFSSTVNVGDIEIRRYSEIVLNPSGLNGIDGMRYDVFYFISVWKDGALVDQGETMFGPTKAVVDALATELNSVHSVKTFNLYGIAVGEKIDEEIFANSREVSRNDRFLNMELGDRGGWDTNNYLVSRDRYVQLHVMTKKIEDSQNFKEFLMALRKTISEKLFVTYSKNSIDGFIKDRSFPQDSWPDTVRYIGYMNTPTEDPMYLYYSSALVEHAISKNAQYFFPFFRSEKVKRVVLQSNPEKHTISLLVESNDYVSKNSIDYSKDLGKM